MRLLHTTTGQFHDFDDPRTVRYAILSHVWARKSETHYPEMSYQVVCGLQEAHLAQEKTSFNFQSSAIRDSFPSEKIKHFCKVAADHDYEYAWADACCIDQTSSSELSEAINSMYNWYRYAGVCYVYLYDVSTPATTSELEAPESPFRKSMWHKRGWTLQELLAPTVVVFMSSDWRIIGTKHSLAHLIHAITGIDSCVLTGERPLEDFSVACRMSWASSRETKRIEDEAYSLMGIFGVNMPTTYGEGQYAFIRLQEEILKHHSDQTIFAWGPVLSSHNFSFHPPHTYRAESDLLAAFRMEASSRDQFLLASSPKDFRCSSNLISIPWDEFMRILGAPLTDRPTYTMTSYGVRTRLPLLAVRARKSQTNVPTCIALLACKDNDGNLMTLLLRSQPRRPEVDYFVGAVVGRLSDIMGSFEDTEPFSMTPAFPQYYFRTAFLSSEELSACSMQFCSEDIYIPYRPSLASYSLQRDISLHSDLRSVSSDHCDLRVSTWCHDLLRMHGYRIIHHPGNNPFVIDIESSTDFEMIRIHAGRCDCSFGKKEGFLSVDVCWKRSDRPGTPVAPPALHTRKHDRHIQSWTFRNGAASKEFRLRSSTDKRITVRLSLTKAAESDHDSYMMGVELWETREADVERERERIKSKVIGKTRQASPPKDSRSRSRFPDAGGGAAPFSLPSRSGPYRPEPSIPVEPLFARRPEPQHDNSFSPAPTTTTRHIPPPPPASSMFRNTSQNVLNGATTFGSWGSELDGTDEESWHSFGRQSEGARGWRTQMSIDTPALSPVDSRISYTMTPGPSILRRPDTPVPSSSPHTVARPPQMLNTLNVLLHTYSQNQPPSLPNFPPMEMEMRPGPGYMPRDGDRRREEWRRAFYIPRSQYDFSLSALAEEPDSPPHDDGHQALSANAARAEEALAHVRWQDGGNTAPAGSTAARSRPPDPGEAYEHLESGRALFGRNVSR